MRKLHVFKNEKETCRSFALWFAEQVAIVLKSQDYFTVAFSSENIPKLFYKTLAAEYADTIDWNRIHIFRADRKILPDSNSLPKQDVAAKALFDHISIPEENLHTIKNDVSPEEAAGQYNELLQSYFLNRATAFNLVVLGMDENGKTSSLYSASIENSWSDTWAVSMRNKDDGTYTVTLTASVINLSDETAFLITGKEKQDAVQNALKGKYDPEKSPAQLLQSAGKPVHWFLDEGSASKLIHVTP